MRFDRLLWHALQAGRGSWSESDPQTRRELGVHLTAQSGETVLFFRTDDNRFREGREHVPLCDLLVFVKAGSLAPVLLFIELKGKDIEHALEQLGETHRRLAQSLDDECALDHTQVRMLVVHYNSAPIADRVAQKRGWRSGNVRVRFARGPKCDLRPFVA